jgi:hypothetical protein
MIRQETIRKALEAIKNPANQDYFFQKLGSPDWIEPLRKAGVFARPEPPIRRDDAEYYSRWPASEYLARMAPRAPGAVTRTFENMEVGDNPWVHRDIVAAALEMPGRYAARLARIETDWLARQERVSLLVAPDYGKLAAKLAAERETDAALRLIRVLFEVRQDVRRSGPALREPRGRLACHEYELVLQEMLPELGKTISEQLLAALCDLLEGAVEASRYTNDPAPPRDFSEIWRPAVEDHVQNRPHTLADALTSAVRDVAVRIAAESPAKRASVVESLERRPWHLFHRIAMHVLCEGGAPALDLAKPRILNRDNFDSIAFRHEYARLLWTFFSNLGEADQNRILGWIDEGPSDLAEWAKFCERENGKAPSEQQRQARSDHWKYERVHPFRESLPDSWKRRCAGWSRQFGEPKFAEFVTCHVSRWGDSSPKTAEELGELPVPELIDLLKSWHPSGKWDEPTAYGLAQELRRAVAMDAVRFAENGTAFVELAPEYVSPILDGLREAIRSGSTLPWPPVLELCLWVTRQPRDVPGRERHRYHPAEPHPGWKWVRATIADLIEQALQRAEGGIPIELRARVWETLAPLADDPDPTPQDEAEREASYDPFTASLNTTRGKAMHAVMRYVLWVARNLPRPRQDELRLARGMGEIAEARVLLEQRLDPSRDASLAIRSVFGHYYPLLAAIDPSWASACRGQIFPPAESDVRLWTAAWNAFVRFNHVYTGVFKLLSREYTRAIDRCGDYPVEDRDLADAKEGLAEHAVILFGRGTVAIEPDGLIDRFFSTVPVALQAHAIDFVGRSLTREQAPPAEIIERFKQLWQWLVEVGEAASGDSVERLRLAAFGSWFTSRQFDGCWSIAALEDALRLAGCVNNSHFVIELLAELAPQFPSEVLRCLRAILRSDKEGWEICGTQDEVRRILKAALSHSDESVRMEATSTVHDLGARGFFSFRDLLRNSQTEPSGESAL